LTLAEILQQAGYETGAFVSYKAMVARGGLDQGFGIVSDLEMPPNPWTHETHVRSGANVNKLAFEFLDGLPQSGRRPTLLWLHYFEPHSPYPMTQYAADRLGDYAGPLADGADTKEFYALGQTGLGDPGSSNVMQHLYDGRVKDADQLVGELMAGLQERNLLEDTIIVVVGDHGQLLGEHGAYGHGRLIWQEVLQVPLLIVDPRAATQVEVAHRRVGVIDLMPTVLDLLDLEIPSYLQGRSLAPAVRNEELDEAVYYAEVRTPSPTRQGASDPRKTFDPVAVFEGPFKFVLGLEPEALYDLTLDPRESNSVALDAQAETLERLRLLASQHKQATADSFFSSGGINPEVLKELQALGYAGEDSE